MGSLLGIWLMSIAIGQRVSSVIDQSQNAWSSSQREEFRAIESLAHGVQSVPSSGVRERSTAIIMITRPTLTGQCLGRTQWELDLVRPEFCTKGEGHSRAPLCHDEKLLRQLLLCGQLVNLQSGRDKSRLLFEIAGHRRVGGFDSWLNAKLP